MQKQIQDFDKIYVLDTNIILNSANNIELLSEKGENLIVLPETVLDEIDSKKSGFDEINFQARSFGRLMEDSEISSIEHKENLTVIEVILDNIYVHIVTKKQYLVDSQNIDYHIINDRKIIEVTNDIASLYKNTIFLSLDIMARTRALSMGLKSESLKIDDSMTDAYDLDFSKTLEIEGYNGDISLIPEIPEHISSLEVIDVSVGKRYYYYKSGVNWEFIDDKNTDKLSSVPRNRGQKVMSKLILDESNDILVISGPAGTGKTYVALGAATRLMDVHKDKYTEILYIRKTIISGDKSDELGFLPGTLDEKISGYTQPMEDSIKSIIVNKTKKKIPKEELTAAISDFKERYNINYGYVGHLRGSTFAKGSIVILDEFQNFDTQSAKTLLSRVGEANKVLIMGSNLQIDTPFLGKANNALTFMMGQCGRPNDSGVQIKGVNLTNVVRSKVAEWADIVFAHTSS